MNIALDIMGGDFAPGCNFDGIVLALAEYGERLHLTLFGPEAVLREGLSQHGIAEGAAGANLALAAQYPDRSLIWINPTNGAPLGLALTIGLHPVPLDADFLAAGGSPILL